ncbi:cytochrome c biogenesis heme-transporting ATPase CcmA [Granulosicoccaceae sp. 1_MG-2023]|nr:cytochrome c biogenesis heme-transporting ATPase CcmA [Granulosicoccaceae sp. 1_MG-2023]
MTLSTDNLACRRGHRTLFSGLNLAVGAGQVLLVEGSNGSGKTSLLKMLSGLRAPDEGEIYWHDTPIRKLGADYRRHLAWLGHDNGIKEDLTAAENLRLATALAPAGPRSLNEALDEVGLRDRKHTLPRLFSAGMKRRLALARLRLLDSRLWILDEPQTALDKTGIALFESILTDHLQAGGMAVMTSHHDVELDESLLVRLRLSE